MQAALDVFNQEPPPADSPLVNRDDVVCTPHLGASTAEAQEGVAVEIADAVIGALKVQGPCALAYLTPCYHQKRVPRRKHTSFAIST